MNTDPPPGKASRRFAEICAAGAGALGVFALLAWLFADWRIAAFGQGYVPTAPSTAGLMILLGGAAFLHSYSPARPLTTGVGFLAVLMAAGMSLAVLAQPLLGLELPVERWLLATVEQVGDIPVGRMSPLTAAVLLAAAVALGFELPPLGRRRLGRQVAAVAAVAALLASAAVLLGYATGVPLLYGSKTIPMALPTSAAAGLLGCALLFAGGSAVWPLSFFKAELLEPSPLRLRRLVRAPVTAFFFLCLVIATTGIFYLRHQFSDSRQTALDSLSAVADLKAGQITDWYQERQADAEIIRQTPMTKVQARQFLAGSSPAEARQELLSWMEMWRKLGHYRRMVLYDAGGSARLVAPPDASAADRPDSPFIAAALRAQSVLTEDLHRDADARTRQSDIRLSWWIPVGVDATAGTRAAGAWLLEIDPGDFLYPLIQNWPTTSATAETLLVRREGSDVVFLNELRHRKNAALALRLPADRQRELPAAMAVMGRTGIVEGADYRGIQVLAALRGIPATPWFMVAKVDREEIYGPLRIRALLTGAILLLMFATTALGVGHLWHRQDYRLLQRQLAAERERQALAERILHLNRQANDIILLMDEDWRILEANDRALGAYGYSQGEMQHRTLRDLRAPESQQDFDDVLSHAAAGQGVILESLHQRKDGSRFRVESSLRAIDMGEKKYHQAIIRDITERKRAEEELKLSLSLLRATLESTADGILVVDAAGDVVDFNQQFRKMWRLPDDIVKTRKDQQLLDFVLEQLADPAGFLAKVQELYAQREREDYDTLQFKDGRVFERYSRPQRIGDRIVGRVWSFRDVTERERAEAAVRLAHERLRRFAEANIVGIVIANAAGAVLEANDYYLRLIGYTRAELEQGKIDWRAVTPPEWLPADERALRELRERGRCAPYEKEYVRRDGTRISVLLADTMLPGAGEQLAAFVLDVTERARADQALRKSEEKLAKAFQAVPDAVTITRLRDGMTLECNDRFSGIFGFSRQEAVGHSALEMGTWVSPEDRKALIRQISATGECHSMEIAFRAKDGRIIPCLLSANGLMIDGEPCMISIIRDISESKRLEDQLRQAQKMEAVGQLAGGVAHDYNNILTAMLIQLGLLLNDPRLPADTKSALKELEHTAERAANLTRQLLMFSRRQLIQVKPVDLNEVLANLLKMLRRLLGENISLEFTGRTAPLWIEADAGMMEQIVTNLCLNARDAMTPKGGRLTIDAQLVELDTRAAWENPEARPGVFVCLSVADTGIGMEAAILARIFEPFFTTKETGKGTGLGLATVYGITKQHRGWIDVSSQVGQGSTFRVFLPAMRETPPVEAETARPEVKRGTETVLLVEDEELVRQMAAMTLRLHGYRVIEAVDGQDAIRRWDEHAGKIDLLFSDMVMPGGITGLDLFRRFKELKPSLKAVISSGYSLELATSNAPAEPDIAFLSKPYEVTTLALAVRRSLDQTKAEPSGRSAAPLTGPPAA